MYKKLLGSVTTAPVFAFNTLMVQGPQKVPSLLPQTLATEFSVFKTVQLADGPSGKTLRVISVGSSLVSKVERLQEQVEAAALSALFLAKTEEALIAFRSINAA